MGSVHTLIKLVFGVGHRFAVSGMQGLSTQWSLPDASQLSLCLALPIKNASMYVIIPCLGNDFGSHNFQMVIFSSKNFKMSLLMVDFIFFALVFFFGWNSY